MKYTECLNYVEVPELHVYSSPCSSPTTCEKCEVKGHLQYFSLPLMHSRLPWKKFYQDFGIHRHFSHAFKLCWNEASGREVSLLLLDLESTCTSQICLIIEFYGQKPKLIFVLVANPMHILQDDSTEYCEPIYFMNRYVFPWYETNNWFVERDQITKNEGIDFFWVFTRETHSLSKERAMLFIVFLFSI